MENKIEYPNIGRAKRANKKRKPVLQYDLDGNFIKEWESGYKAAECLKVSNGPISIVCNGKGLTAYGFKWKFKHPKS